MTSVRKLRVFGTQIEDVPTRLSDALPHGEGAFLKTVGWVSAGAGALGLGLIVGRELRRRYKFHRRTPYDIYAHAGGGYTNDVEFGVGI